MKKISTKQGIFCQEYSAGASGTESALKAGYAKSSASVQACRMLVLPQIQKELTRLSDIREKANRLTAQFVIESIRNTVIATSQLKAVEAGTDENGNIVYVSIPVDAQASLRGCELLGRSLALFTDKISNSNTDLSTLTDEELTRELAIANSALLLAKNQDVAH
jgi:phage terminase small subunit